MDRIVHFNPAAYSLYGVCNELAHYAELIVHPYCIGHVAGLGVKVIAVEVACDCEIAVNIYIGMEGSIFCYIQFTIESCIFFNCEIAVYCCICMQHRIAIYLKGSLQVCILTDNEILSNIGVIVDEE